MSDQASNAGGPHGMPTDDRFNVIRVVMTIVVLAVIGGGGFMLYEYAQNRPEPLYPVRGVVYLDGEPMPDGVVMTIHTDGGMPAIGPIKPDGTFELSTNGEPGAYGGEHKVRVAWTDGGFPPFSFISLDYGDPDKTPFTVTVDSSTSEEPVKLELEGRREPPTRPAGGEGGSRYPGPPQGGTEGAERGATTEGGVEGDHSDDNAGTDEPAAGGKPTETNESASETSGSTEAEDAEKQASDGGTDQSKSQDSTTNPS